MQIFFKRLVVEEQSEKSNNSSIWEHVHPSLIQGDPSILVSSLIFKSKHCRNYLYEWKATQCLLTAKLEASTSIL